MTTLTTNKIISIEVLKPLKSFDNLLRMATLLIIVLGICFFIISCTKKDESDIEPELTSEQQKFADLFAPNTDGTPKSITVNIGEPSDLYYMPELFRIEMKLVNAKSGNFEITPWISRKPIEDVINIAMRQDPGKIQYGANIAFVIKNADGTTFSPTSTQSIIDKDDNNPLTVSPAISQLPAQFTMDIFKQFNPNATASKSYTLNKDQELQLWINVLTVGKQLATYKHSLKPIEILTNGK
jgi:hypothetical protein